ncbi:TonB-dependent receptor [Horticoccus sp. 23ND18S-11]|uniref:TonB-dependent receptor n=1 Tax=Horticoccus sp. 23ND18S-11 TaxID=3391832 RepID=UPI0039C9EAC1
MRLTLIVRICSVVGTLLLSQLAHAQTSATGTITGRVLNPANGEYVRNAQIRVEGTALSASSEDGGLYLITGVPAGPATITVTYTGSQPASAKVNVTAGGTVTRDFELTSALEAGKGTGDSPIKLTAFKVSSEREGNAKAIMQQRNSMNITNSVASDVFGDVAEGNVGEFLKHMPGVELDLVQGEIRTIRLRGLDSEYTQVTLDGVSLASADANAGAAGNARAFSFEQVSLSSMESIEVSKTISADVDANAPAGTINLKTKRAFDLTRRRVSAQANLTAFSTRFNFDDSYGPDDRKSRKLHPGGIFDYSDVFFNRRLGINLNISESMAYSANARTTMTYNYTPTAADPRPVVPTAINFLHAPRTNRRSTVNFTADYRASSRLVLSLGLLYNYADLNNPQRSLTFNTGARNTVTGADPLLSFTTTAPAANVVSNPAAIVKLGQTLTALPRFEYRAGNFTLEGKFAGSNSISWYDPRGRRGSMRDAGGPTLTGLTYTARRSSLKSVDWKVVQTGGPDMDNGANYTNPTVTIDDGRYALTDVYSGEFIGTLRTNKFLPIIWKAGVKRRYEIRDFRLDTESLRFNLNGAGAAGAWAGYKSPFDFDMGATNTDSSIKSIGGGTVWMPDLVRMGTYYRENQNNFTQSITAANFYNAFIGNRRNYEETIDAGFLMGTTTIGKLVLRAGLRREETSTDSLEFNPRSVNELAAAGFAETAGRATTIDGLKYQFFSKPKVHRESGYNNMFPSASVKYKINQNFDAQIGFSSTIRRPTFRDVAGVWVINDDNLTVSAPNTALKPETSKNLAARLAYYFEPVGILAINVYQNNVKGLFITNRLTAQEFGYQGDIDLSNYEFITTTASVNDVTVRGMELEYSQSLSFLPQPFKGLNVRASYTRSYASIPKANMIPHSINAGLSYGYRRFNVYSSLNWRDNYPTTITGNPRFYRHRANIDVGGGYRITDRINVFFAARNLFNEPYLIMEKVGANAPAVQFYEVNGTNWTFGVKSTF